MNWLARKRKPDNKLITSSVKHFNFEIVVMSKDVLSEKSREL